jgi:hypothetical protein
MDRRRDCSPLHSVAAAKSSRSTTKSSSRSPKWKKSMGIVSPNNRRLTSSPSLQKISDTPEEYYTHYIKLKPSSRKGQTRFRCKTCLHEFECSGKVRRLQHILGNDFSLSKERNVRCCPVPYQPLKSALLAVYRGDVQEPEPSLQSLSTDSSRSILVPSLCTTREDCDSPDISTDEVCSPFAGKIPTIFNSLSSSLDEDDDFCSSPSSLSSDPSPMFTSHQNQNAVRVNQVLSKFLSAYKIPITAVEEPLFTNFIQVICATTDSDYRPSFYDIDEMVDADDENEDEDLPFHLMN